MKTYTATIAMKILWFAVMVLSLGLLLAALEREASYGNIALEIAKSLFAAYVLFGLTTFKIVLNPDLIQWDAFGKSQTYAWDEFIEFQEGSFLFFHFYHLSTQDKRIRPTSWSGVTITNFGINNYGALLANAIRHLKPGTLVADSILRHLNIDAGDIGADYRKEIWVNKP